MKPYEFSEKIQKWMYEGKPLRIIVTDSPTNMQCLIQMFQYLILNGTFVDTNVTELYNTSVTE